MTSNEKYHLPDYCKMKLVKFLVSIYLGKTNDLFIDSYQSFINERISNSFYIKIYNGLEGNKFDTVKSPKIELKQFFEWLPQEKSINNWIPVITDFLEEISRHDPNNTVCSNTLAEFKKGVDNFIRFY